MPRRKYTPELLAEAAAQVPSIADALRLLGLRVSGGSHAHISRQLERFGVDTRHFTGSAHNRGARHQSAAPLDVDYDDTATTPTGIPLGGRSPRRQEWLRDVYAHASKGP